MKRVTFLIVLIALGLILGIDAVTVAVGALEDHSPVFPVNYSRPYNYTQQIYTRSQINFQGEIAKIKFYPHLMGEQPSVINWTIYMGLVNRNSFSSTSNWVPGSFLTQVFSGNLLSNLPPAGQWMEIVLDTPFYYDNVHNLVVATYGYNPVEPSILYWGSFASGGNTGLCFSSFTTTPDIYNPPTGECLLSELTAIQLVFTDNTAPVAPLPVSPVNNGSIHGGECLEWTLANGSADASGYDVYIDGTLVSENQPGTQYVLGDLEVGDHYWYVFARNDYGISLPSRPRYFNYYMGVKIGTGTERGDFPFRPYVSYTYSQSIFLQSDINIGNQHIEKIGYHWVGEGDGASCKDWAIYMGHTQRTSFTDAADWMPLCEMIKVFEGEVDIPATAGWVEIELDIPFAYNNVDNLVIAVDENTEGGSGNSSQGFYHTFTGYQGHRSIRHYSDLDIDPEFPPNGETRWCIPNLWMRFDDLPDNPLLRLTNTTVDFRSVMHSTPSEPIKVLVSNMGSGTLNLTAADISIIGGHAAEFSFDATCLPAALCPGQYLHLPVSVTGLSVGSISAVLRIVHNGENHDVPLAAVVLPSGGVIIGEDSFSHVHPFGGSDRQTCSATLYTVEQINAIGNIDMLAWDCEIPSSTLYTYKVWAKNTTDTELERQRWNDFKAGMTLLKQGSYVPETMGWQHFQMDNPFVYHGQNLIIAVETSTNNPPPYYAGHRFKYSDVGSSRHQHWYGGYNDNTANGVLNSWMSNIIMQMSSEVVNDLTALSFSGCDTPSEGATSTYTVRVRNSGVCPQSNYQVKLMNTDGTELVSVPCPTIESGATIEVEVPWIPTASGTFNIYAKVVLTTDELSQNDQTATLRVQIQPEGTQASYIGAGNELSNAPYVLGTRSIYEAIYLADELNFAQGSITSLALYNQFKTAAPGEVFQIYLGSTTQNDLSSGLIPASELVLVFDGSVDFPAGENTIVIDFDTPYLYTGDNLVIMFYSPFDNNTNQYSYNYFKCQTVTGSNRARYDSWLDNFFDPFYPGSGRVGRQLPKIAFFYRSAQPENDLGLTAIDGDFTPSVGVASEYTLSIRNNGTCPQGNYQLKLLGPDDTQLAVVDGPVIGSQQSLELVIPWTPVTAGITHIRGKVELTGDEAAANNLTKPMQVRVQAQGIQAVTIGAGGELYATPLMSDTKTSIYEVVYRADELGFTAGTIDSISIYIERLYSDGANWEAQVYLGSTDQIDLSEGFIPVNELTLIYDGIMDYPVGARTLTFNLETPYLHAGGNLVMAFCRPWSDNYSLARFYAMSKIKPAIHGRYHYSYQEPIYDFSQPPEGNIINAIPQTTFYYNPIVIQNDLSALSISGEKNPSADEASTYTVRIRNNGASTQANYSVKLVGSDSMELASVAGPPLNSQQTVEVEIPWTPSETGHNGIYGKVELVGDEHEVNDQSFQLQTFTYPAGASALTIGTGHINLSYCLGMDYKNTLFETLYLADQMAGNRGYITGMQFYNNFINEVTDVPVSVWLGTTTQEDLTGGWIPSTQLTQVFDGLVDFYPGISVVNILFDQPYLYLGGTNLVMMISKSTDATYSYRNNLKTQYRYTNCSRFKGSSNMIDPTNPPTYMNRPSGYYPQTTFRIIPVEVAQISGAVVDADNQPLSGVEVSLNNGQSSTVTNDAGEYQLANVIVSGETCTITFSKFAYYDFTQSFELQPDQELVLDADMQLLPRLNVIGTILASDTGAGIVDALIALDGYEAYSANTNEAGLFIIPLVYGDKCYDYSISAPGYTTFTGQFELGTADLYLGEITLNELAYAPLDVVASVNADDAVEITWQAADPEPGRHKPERAKRAAAPLKREKLTKKDRALTGYQVYRLRAEQQENEAVWVPLTPEVTQALSISDPDWTLLPGGDYCWAVVSVYTNDVTSVPSFSNILNWDFPNGTIAGTVRRKDNSPIAGAIISSGTETAITDSTGAYSLLMPIGVHDVRAEATGFSTQISENELVNYDAITTVDFVLLTETSADEPSIPVVATTLNGNYPNPFNPETTISYSVKEPGRVKLEIYNIKGQKVRTLVDSDHATGHYTRLFNARDDRGRNISSGVYLIRMSAPGYRKTAKMILMQ